MSSRGYSKGTAYTKRLRINSANRMNSNDSDTDFTIDVGESLQRVSQLSVVSAQFTNAFYNVFQTSRKFNNAWYYSIYGEGTFQGSITPGRYSVSSLGNAIAAAMNSYLPDTTLTFTQDPITNLVTLTLVTGQATMIFLKPTTLPGGFQGTMDFWPFGLLGFNDSFTLSNGQSVTATFFPSLNNPSLAYITSAALAPGNSLDEKGKISNILLPIDITAPYLGLQTFETKVDVLHENNFGLFRPINIIDIQLVDHDGDPLDLHGTPLALELRIWMNNY